MFYDGLSHKIKETLMVQDYDHADASVTLATLAEKALKVDQRLEQFAAQHKGSSPLQTNLEANPALYVYAIVDGKAKKGVLQKIGQNAKGIAVPIVKWNDGTTMDVTFKTIKKDNHPVTATPLLLPRLPPPPLRATLVLPYGLRLCLLKGKKPIICATCGASCVQQVPNPKVTKKMKPFFGWAMIDSGASSCFIHKDLIKQYGKHSIVLGMSWLKLHNPTIDWPNKRITFNSQYCNNTCLSVSNSILGNVGGTSNHLEGIPEDLGGVEVIEPLEGIPRETGGTVDSPLESIPVELRNFAEVFSEDMKVTELPPHRPFDLGIDLIDPDKPVKAMVYPLKASDDEELRKLLKEQLDKGLIRPSKSKYGSPVHFVNKKNGKRRMVVDYRSLNANTVKNAYPLPLIQSLIEKLRGAKYFSTIDLKSGYNLVRIKEGDEWKTAFKTKYGLFEYLVMPFGLCNAPAAFQHFMNEIFRDILDVYVVVYLDDILIFSESRELHTKHLQEVLKRLQDNACYCNLEKCNFYASEVDYLGVIANGEGVKADPKKITQAVDWATPRSVKGNIPWEWGERQEVSFKALKQALIESPVLIQPDPYKEFFLECDASDFATGAVLNQKGSDDKLHPVAFLSKSLAPAERNYDIFDKELLAVVRALKEWRHLLEGTVIPVKILTDHKNLEYFQTKRDLNQRQLRPGAQNRKADILSRREDHKSAVKEGGETPVLISPELFIAAIQTDSDLNDLIRDALHDDKAVYKILKSLEEDIPVKGWKLIMAYSTIMTGFMSLMSQKSGKPS
ncbi:Chromo (CHRromatin Organization MOdifier) domain [Rhizoctonia solani]|uniref:Chromo (CHRromatin Organization MOdifier) domain n=1 Tax=Rhizoctonia solani TaxID=456999 RepID=A0A8H7I5I7_9AGAM|nr:Chromo (CHRromatin Organization MOdifier) domain [Rhizoctonia solani]